MALARSARAYWGSSLSTRSCHPKVPAKNHHTISAQKQKQSIHLSVAFLSSPALKVMGVPLQEVKILYIHMYLKVFVFSYVQGRSCKEIVGEVVVLQERLSELNFRPDL